mmetsp:Transcript_7400/g.23514  ORF Transcript_7400/g.23514 Transcript_7400/m.23514 type:complete len:257 (+) Transcript_7400:522-1292(+)
MRYHQEPRSTFISISRTRASTPGSASKTHPANPGISTRRNMVVGALRRSTTSTTSPSSMRVFSFADLSYVGALRRVTPCGSSTAYLQLPISGSPERSSTALSGVNEKFIFSLRSQKEPESVEASQQRLSVWVPSRKSSTQPSKPTRRRNAPRRTRGRTRSTATTSCPAQALEAGGAPRCGRGRTGNFSVHTSYCHSPCCTSTSTMRTFRSFGETSKTQPSPLLSESHRVHPDLRLRFTSTTVPAKKRKSFLLHSLL